MNLNIDKYIFYKNNICFARLNNFILSSTIEAIFNKQMKVIGYEFLATIIKGDINISYKTFMASTNIEEKILIEAILYKVHIENYIKNIEKVYQMFLNINLSFFYNEETYFKSFQIIADNWKKNIPLPLVLEINESKPFFENAFNLLLHSCKENNFIMAIDDYGKEDSNNNRIELINPYYIKLDKKWFNKQLINDHCKDQLMAFVFLNVLKGYRIIIEGIESSVEYEFAKKIEKKLGKKADNIFLQGYLLAKPINL